jgi:alpha-tubulin suppressor-like RCC1 family protein
MAIDKNGRVWGWGLNDNGQLGDNSITSRRTPVSVLGAVKTFCLISAGGNHTMAINKNGRAWGWGFNSSGQLGDNSITSRRTPVSVLGAVKTFCLISAGNSHTMVIDKNGRAWCWGNNDIGQLGDNSITSRRTPVSVLGAVKTFCLISAGSNHTMAIDKNGRAWGWGSNVSGQLGDNSVTSRRTPVSVLGAVKTFCQISAAINNAFQSHTVAIDKNGRSWGWGNNDGGQLGDNSNTSRRTPVSVLGTTKTFCKIYAAGFFTIAIDKNGGVWGWGAYQSSNFFGLPNTFTPLSICGSNKTFCLISAGGNNSGSHTIAIDKNGRAWGWGFNGGGQLGDNSTTSRRTPVSVLGAIKTFCRISAGSNHTMAIDKNGRAWGWGNNGSGQLGNNSTSNIQTPVSVLGAVKTFCRISAGLSATVGLNHTTAIDKNGRAWGWGNNGNGQLGDNSITSRLTPVSVLGAVKTFCLISAGGNHTMSIDKNGRAWGWGLNGNGELGNNSVTSIRTPVSVLGAVKTFCLISTGLNYTMAINKNGRAWGWGLNGNGQLGDNSITSRRTPVSVLGAVKTFCQISTGSEHTVAIDKNGRAWCWGYNLYGQLGDNSVTVRRTPVSVLGAVKTFCLISAGNNHTIAIDKNGRVWGWGDPIYLGINRQLAITPTSISYL